MQAGKIGKRTLQAVAVAGNLAMAAALCVSAYGGMANPDKHTWLAIAAMTFPIMVIIDLALLLFNLCFPWLRKVAIVNVVGLLACLGPLFTFCPVNLNHSIVTEGDEEYSDDPTFTLMTYNAYEFLYAEGPEYDGFSPQRGLSYIIASDPDVVVMQEVAVLSPLQRWRLAREQVDTLRERYPFIIINKFGLGILSKFPADSVCVNKDAFNQSLTADFTCYRLHIKGRLLHIYNVHLQSIGLTRSDKELYHDLTRADFDRESIAEARRQLMGKLGEAFRQRALQARALRHNIDSIGGNTIVCGDFNDIPGCYASRVVRGDNLRDAYSDAGCGPAITYYANRFYFRIDHIFYSRYLKPVTIERPRLKSSDHYPLLCTFAWD